MSFKHEADEFESILVRQRCQNTIFFNRLKTKTKKILNVNYDLRRTLCEDGSIIITTMVEGTINVIQRFQHSNRLDIPPKPSTQFRIV